MSKSISRKKVLKGAAAFYCLLWFILSSGFQQIYAAGKAEGEKEKQEHVFSTWEGFEPDKCASIWLIQHFIDSNAIIKFFPKGDAITEGIPFDIPDAKFRRYATMSTFESLLHHYHLH